MNRNRFPVDDDPDAIRDYVERFFNDRATYRWTRCSHWALNIAATLDQQWISWDSEAIPNAARELYSVRLHLSGRDESVNEDFPRPQTNILAPAVEVEIAQYLKRKFVPKIDVRTGNPEHEAAAKLANDVLAYRLEKNHWPQILGETGFYLVTTGTGAIKSYWDESYFKTTTVGSPFAAQCPACGAKVASQRIPFSAAGSVEYNSSMLRDKLAMPELDEDELYMPACPHCESPSMLEPYEPIPSDEGSSDFLGRSLLMQAPVGDSRLEVVPPFELFVQNHGIFTDHKSCRIYGTASVRDIGGWVQDRFPDMVDKVQPDSPQILMDRHPLFGDWSFYEYYARAQDAGICDDHVRVYELIHLPCYYLPKGRYIAVAGNDNPVILHAGPLVETFNGIECPRVKIIAAPFKPRPREFWGHSMIDTLRSPQNRLNGLDSQFIQARDHMGMPFVLAPTSTNMEGPEWDESGRGGRIIRYEPDAATGAKPEIVYGATFPSEAYQERDRILNDARYIQGPQDVEIGAAPKNITTTSGLQLSGENAEQRRAQREDAMEYLSKESWSHQLELERVFRVDPAPYEVKDSKTHQMREAEYTREDLIGPLRTSIEKQAFVEASILTRENAREAQADGLLGDPATFSPAMRRRLLELRGLPADIAAEENYQVDAANRQWTEFIDLGKIPYIDEDLDNAAIHASVLSTWLASPDGIVLHEAVGWPEVGKILTGWQELYYQMKQADDASKSFYGRFTPPEEVNATFAQLLQRFQEEQVTYPQRLAEAQAQLSVNPMAPIPPPPQMPPQPSFLPNTLDGKVLAVWKEILRPYPIPAEQAEGLDLYLKLRAVVEAYKLLATPPPAPMLPPGAGAESGQMVGTPPQAPNPPNPMNAPTPGTSAALANAAGAVTGGQ